MKPYIKIAVIILVPGALILFLMHRTAKVYAASTPGAVPGSGTDSGGWADSINGFFTSVGDFLGIAPNLGGSGGSSGGGGTSGGGGGTGSSGGSGATGSSGGNGVSGGGVGGSSTVPFTAPKVTPIAPVPVQNTPLKQPAIPGVIGAGTAAVKAGIGGIIGGVAGVLGIATALGVAVFELLGGEHNFRVTSPTTGQVFENANPTIALAEAGYPVTRNYIIAGQPYTFQGPISQVNALLVAALQKAGVNVFSLDYSKLPPGAVPPIGTDVNAQYTINAQGQIVKVGSSLPVATQAQAPAPAPAPAPSRLSFAGSRRTL